MKLESFAVDGLNDAYYIPDFVSEDEEMYLIRKASHLLKAVHDSVGSAQ